MLIESEELKSKIKNTYTNPSLPIDMANMKEEVLSMLAELEQAQTTCKHQYHPYCKSHGFIINVLSCKEDCGDFQLLCKICFEKNSVINAEQKHERD